jgi:uncharacterized sulfatase
MGSYMDTARQFRNLHAYPLMQTKNDIIDFVMGNYLLNGSNLYRLDSTLDATPDQKANKKIHLQNAFTRFKEDNKAFIATLKIVPDSLLEKYTPKK